MINLLTNLKVIWDLSHLVGRFKANILLIRTVFERVTIKVLSFILSQDKRDDIWQLV